MIKFIVYRQGVYMQGIFGIYNHLDEAIYATEEFINEESDDYHSFEIIEAKIGKSMKNVSPVYKISRRDTYKPLKEEDFGAKKREIASREITHRDNREENE